MSNEETKTPEVLSATEDLVEVRAGVQEEPPIEEPSPVAIYYGLELKLPSGGSAAFLACSANQNYSGFFVKGAKPSDEDEDRVACQHCRTPHYVVSLATALEEQRINLQEGGPGVMPEDVLATLLREGETGRA